MGRKEMERQLSEIVSEMEKLATGLIKLQAITVFREVLSLFEAEKKEEARKLAKEKWEDLDYEYYALDQGSGGELAEISKEQKAKLFSLSLWLEEGQHWLIQILQVEPGVGLSGPLMAMIIDKGLEKGKRAYPALLRELMEAVK